MLTALINLWQGRKALAKQNADLHALAEEALSFIQTMLSQITVYNAMINDLNAQLAAQKAENRNMEAWARHSGTSSYETTLAEAYPSIIENIDSAIQAIQAGGDPELIVANLNLVSSALRVGYDEYKSEITH